MESKIKAVFKGAPGEERETFLSVSTRRPIVRLGRAVGALVCCWAAAGLALFIPVVHLVLLPLFALGGPLLAYRIGSKKGEFTGPAEGCPKCEAPIPISGISFRFPFYVTCPKCSQRVFVEQAIS